MTVTFSKTRKVRVFPKVSEEEKQVVWWTQADFRGFRRQCWQTLKAIEASGESSSSRQPLNEDQCTRGLEDWEKENYTARRKRMRDAILGVILEQECLTNEGRKDEVRISIQYAKLSEESRKIALSKGVLDSQHIENPNKVSSRKGASPDRKRRNPFAVSHETVTGCKPSRSFVFKNALRKVSS